MIISTFCDKVNLHSTRIRIEAISKLSDNQRNSESLSISLPLDHLLSVEVHAFVLRGNQRFSVSAHIGVHLTAVDLDVHTLLLFVHISSRKRLETYRVHNTSHFIQSSRSDVALEEHDLVAIVVLPFIEDLFIERCQNFLIEVSLFAKVSLRMFEISRGFWVIKRIVTNNVRVLRESFSKFVPEIKELVLKLLFRVVKLIIEVYSFRCIS